MDPKEPSSSSGRKLKFTPKPPRRRNPVPPPNPNPSEAEDERRRWKDLGRNAAHDTTEASVAKTKKDYQEPWDYEGSYYPTTLPLRKPYSGDPETLNEEEFGDAASDVPYDESTINPAAELGLSEKSEQPIMHMVQLPCLPMFKELTTKKGEEKVGSSSISGEWTKLGSLDDLPEGFLGKMLVYKSGAVKLKLGEILLDVSPGVHSKCPQEVVAINTAQKHCCVIGPISNMVTVTPDLDNLKL